MSHLPTFKLKDVTRYSIPVHNKDHVRYEFEDEETKSEIILEITDNRNSFSYIGFDIRDYQRWGCPFEDELEGVKNKVMQLEGLL